MYDIRNIDIFDSIAVRNYLIDNGLKPLFWQLSQQQHCPAPFFYSVGQHTLLCYDLIPRFVEKTETEDKPGLTKMAAHYVSAIKYGVLVHDLAKALYNVEKVQNKIWEIQESDDKAGIDILANLPNNLDMAIQTEARLFVTDTIGAIIHQIDEEASIIEADHFNDIEFSLLIEETAPVDVYNRLIRLYTDARIDYLAD